MSLNKDTLLNAVLAASGGKQVVKYNVNGDPCFFTRIPRFNLEDIHPGLGTGPHPAFIVNGVIKAEILIAPTRRSLTRAAPFQSPASRRGLISPLTPQKRRVNKTGRGFIL